MRDADPVRLALLYQRLSPSVRSAALRRRLVTQGREKRGFLGTKTMSKILEVCCRGHSQVHWDNCCHWMFAVSFLVIKKREVCFRHVLKWITLLLGETQTPSPWEIWFGSVSSCVTSTHLFTALGLDCLSSDKRVKSRGQTIFRVPLSWGLLTDVENKDKPPRCFNTG
jgi:hypothetical protein